MAFSLHRPRTHRRSENLVNHLNAKHPDTVLFLARFAGAIPEAVQAELLTIDADGIDVAVAQPHASTTQRIAFTDTIKTLPDPRSQLSSLLAHARAVAGPDEPLTLLEQKGEH